MEMERRKREDLEELQRRRRENEEREREAERLEMQKERAEEERKMQEAEQRAEEEKRANEQMALEMQHLFKERLQCNQVMAVQKYLVTRPRYTIGDLRAEQQRRREEAELKANFKCLASSGKSHEQSRRETLINNWVGQEKTDCETLQEDFRPTDSTRCPTAENASLKSKKATSKSSKLLTWLQKSLKSGLSSDKKQDRMERMREASRLRERYREQLASKDRCCSRLSEQIDGYCMSRNRILKKSIF
ncbi:GRB10-interacting GYF protein 2-like [Xiphias gladius]|uniref:GRB10-interacting GYF protein 2-like n=1 Tax=Xiphias gladius TaxID=8245 RepID=UPI001A99EAE1|nr:GRB10-interacting GYF protein 2-like [Xiphias gladius]